jgi:hypothetical protein
MRPRPALDDATDFLGLLHAAESARTGEHLQCRAMPRG